MSTRLAIVNPEAGQGHCGRMAGPTMAALRRRGVDVEVWYTRRPGHAVELARKGHEQGFRDFIAVGGDGTSHEIINGLGEYMGKRDESRVSLGFMPLGTGNSFVRDFMVPDVEALSQALVRGHRRPSDVIRVTHSAGVLYFLNIFSFGFVAEVCLMANEHLKGLGPSGYGVSVLAKLAGIKPTMYKMQLDDTPVWEQRALVLSINNSQYTGGEMHIAPYADTADGEMDVMLVAEISRTTFVRLFAKMFSGDHVHHPAIINSRARRIRFELNHEVPVMVDGEVLQLRPLEMEVVPQALDVVL